VAVLADGEAEAFELGRQALVHLDHFVECVGDLARDTDPVIGQPHREVTLADGLQRAQETRQVDRGGGLCDTSHLWCSFSHALSGAYVPSRTEQGIAPTKIR